MAKGLNIILEDLIKNESKYIAEDGKILKEVCPPASIIFTPSVAGMLCAYYVCKNI